MKKIKQIKNRHIYPFATLTALKAKRQTLKFGILKTCFPPSHQHVKGFCIKNTLSESRRVTGTGKKILFAGVCASEHFSGLDILQAGAVKGFR